MYTATLAFDVHHRFGQQAQYSNQDKASPVLKTAPPSWPGRVSREWNVALPPAAGVWQRTGMISLIPFFTLLVRGREGPIMDALAVFDLDLANPVDADGSSNGEIALRVVELLLS